MSLSARPHVHERSFARDRLEVRVHLADGVTIALHLLGGRGCSSCKRHRVGLLLSEVRLVGGRRARARAAAAAGLWRWDSWAVALGHHLSDQALVEETALWQVAVEPTLGHRAAPRGLELVDWRTSGEAAALTRTRTGRLLMAGCARPCCCRCVARLAMRMLRDRTGCGCLSMLQLSRS